MILRLAFLGWALSACACSGLSSTTGSCKTAADCPQPANSTAVCTNDMCSFSCASPLLRCGGACCSAVAITAGDAHTCALTSEGGVKCWGAAATVGDGTFDARTSPVDVVGLSAKAVSISAGLVHTCAQLVNGRVECWGVNTLGNGVNAPAPQAKPVSLGPVSQLSSGGSHACAIADGGVFCWGSDTQGQQGTSGGGLRLTPGSVSGLVYDVSQIATGSSHSCALLNDGGARCWGNNVAGECGDGTQLKRTVPVAVTAIDAGIVELHAGFGFTCARTQEGLKCWGTNGSGECGHGVVIGRSLVAVDVLGVGPGLTRVALGPYARHACVVQDAGVYCWGSSDHGQLGDGNLGIKNAPVRALGIDVPITAAAVGGRHTCAITAEGGVLCWGDNAQGQLGDGSKGGNRLSPVSAR